ncbi:trypsin-like peptidase domain-containing protein [Actinoplanes bogorensis]|uniref:Trypsin-like peptidase domain-containing protein n=1 Tax=Paractinoplanes bogorensis TaxID=1610840 RepID=A0ABS5YYG6_9ACTN|nr:trypsin-like peptidase domain-containing protein [Actinoplanes bogorensis]MBU2667140.1 trypsin-like peptidase domain-containing protein [Actinoplanes bogorensis]
MIPDVHTRVVEVLRAPGGRGTGYAVTADLVLTAAHVVADETGVRVLSRGGELPGTVIWRHPGLDAALVRVPGRPWHGIDTSWGTLSGVQPVRCTAIGYPQVQRSEDGTLAEEQLDGFIMPATGHRSGRYAINVVSALPYEVRLDRSPWSGMSGAAVLSSDGRHVLGLLTDDPTGFEPSRLEAVPADGLLGEAGFVDLIRTELARPLTVTDVSASESRPWPGAEARGSSWAWLACLESGDGKPLGLGFLVDATHVVTRAQAIEGHSLVRVTFPHAAVAVSIEAGVDFRGPWNDERSDGDVAVVRLAVPVPIVPAVLASPTELRDRRLGAVTGELLVHGFPHGPGQAGVDIRVCAPYDVPGRTERVTLEPLGSRPVPMAEGFGGSAVTLADSGAVVGMLVGGMPVTGGGFMLPLDVLRSYWSPLADLLPLGTLAREAAQDLRRVLDRVRVDASPYAIYHSSLPSGIGPVPPPLPTLWEAARFVAEELIAPSGDPAGGPLARFCLALLRRTDSARWHGELRSWLKTHLSVDDDAGPAAATARPGTGSVVVRVTPSADDSQVSLTVTSSGDHGGHVLLSGRRPVGAVRFDVEQVLPEALERIPERVAPEDVLIRFELPLSWLGKPVDEWRAGDRDAMPIGLTYPVVVQDLGLAGVAADRSRLVRRRWQLLGGQTTSEIRATRCADSRDRRGLAAWLTGDPRSILTLPTPPRNPESDKAVRAALSVGLPVILWPRTKCADEHGGDAGCDGARFVETLRRALGPTAPRNLPDRVRELRVAAVSARDELARCRSVTLFWHDPDTRPHEAGRLELAQ